MKWINTKEIPPRKDIPILVICEGSEFAGSVKWVENGTYGYPGFFDSEREYATKEEDVLWWMPLPPLKK